MKRWCYMLVTVVLLVGCDQQGDVESGGQDTSTTATSSSPSLAWVDGKPITEADVVRSVVTTVGPRAMENLKRSERRVVLESLVKRRAIAEVAFAELSDAEQSALDAEIRDFREQLLVKRYLRETADVPPITETMLREYYDSHPEEFGGGVRRDVEIIEGQASTSDGRADLISALAEFERQPDWRAYAQAIRDRGLQVTYTRREFKPDLLHERLASLIETMKSGEVSPALMINGTPYIVRVASMETRVPRPLSEVRGQIRRALLPEQVKKAVALVSEDVLDRVDIRYAQDGTTLSLAEGN